MVIDLEDKINAAFFEALSGDSSITFVQPVVVGIVNEFRKK